MMLRCLLIHFIKFIKEAVCKYSDIYNSSLVFFSSMSISGLVKYKFYDFIVNEIYEGKPLDLTSPPPHYDEFTETLKFFTPGFVYEPTVDLDEFDKIVTLPEDVSTELKSFLRAAKANSKFSFTPPAECDKL